MILGGFWEHLPLGVFIIPGAKATGIPGAKATGLCPSLSFKENLQILNYGRKNKNRTGMAPWRTNLMKKFLSLHAKKNQSSYSLKKQALVISVNICYKYRELVISSLMTIYLVFCKSKAKYHMLCRPLIRQAPGKQPRLPELRER